MVALFGRWRNPRLRRAAPDEAQLARQEREWRQLRRGELPESAQQRLSGPSGRVFTCDLDAGELVALRAAGYQPLGQAFGTATFMVSAANQSLMRYAVHSGGSFPRTTGTSSSIDVFSPLNPRLINGYFAGVNTARATALTRLRAECVALAGDGVLGLRVVRSSPQPGLHEYTVIGTVVRAASPHPPGPPGEPFTTMLGAVEVGRLGAGGWRPMALVYEHQRFGGHGGWLQYGGGRLNGANYSAQEITSASALTGYAAGQVHQRLQRAVGAATGGRGGMILHEFGTDLDFGECIAYSGHSDVFVDIEAVGTSIVPAPTYSVSRRREPLDILPVLHL